MSLPKQNKNRHWLWSACSLPECRIPTCQIVENYFAIYKSRGKCRKWQLRAEIDGEFEGDEGYVKTRVFHGTYSEAQDAKDEFVAAIERGEVRRERGMLFPAYAEAWLAERAAKVAYDTLQKNRCHIVCANMHLSKARIEEIRPGRTWMRCTRPSETARALQAGPCPEPTCATYP